MSENLSNSKRKMFDHKQRKNKTAEDIETALAFKISKMAHSNISRLGTDLIQERDLNYLHPYPL